MIEKIEAMLRTMGYSPIANSNQILMCKETEKDFYVVSLLEYNDQIPAQSYIDMACRFRNAFQERYAKPVRCLHIYLTHGEITAKQRRLTEQLSGLWYVDRLTGRIFVFENQPCDFDGIYEPLDALCRQKRNRLPYIPYMNLMLVAANIFFFIWINHFMDSAAAELIYQDLALDWQRVLTNQEWYRLLSCMFLHADLSHLYGNMLLLFFIGNYMEKGIGHFWYGLLYFSTGIMAGLGSMFYHYTIMSNVICIGASGAIMGVLGAMTGLLIMCRGRNQQFNLRRLLLFFGLTVAQGMLTPRVDNAAHICGFLAGLLFAVLCCRWDKRIDKK